MTLQKMWSVELVPTFSQQLSSSWESTFVSLRGIYSDLLYVHRGQTPSPPADAWNLRQYQAL